MRKFYEFSLERYIQAMKDRDKRKGYIMPWEKDKNKQKSLNFSDFYDQQHSEMSLS